MGQLVLGRFSVRCRCGKIVGLSLEDARMQYRKFSKKHGSTNPVRYYRCQYNSWHWTRKLEWKESTTPPCPRCGKTIYDDTHDPEAGSYCTLACHDLAKQYHNQARRAASRS